MHYHSGLCKEDIGILPENKHYNQQQNTLVEDF
jgi:hypothetical protein